MCLYTQEVEERIDIPPSTHRGLSLGVKKVFESLFFPQNSEQSLLPAAELQNIRQSFECPVTPDDG